MTRMTVDEGIDLIMIALGMVCLLILIILIVALVTVRIRSVANEKQTKACISEYRQRGREVSDKCFVFLLDKGYLKLEGK